MAGQLGNVNLTIKTCEVLHVSPTDNILVLKGSLPGKANNILKITAKG
jgi:ribosomal protein L3